MPQKSREFQIFAKPTGARCNLKCHYCYYLDKTQLYQTNKHTMSDNVLERYIIQHIEATTEDVIMFSWHGGEPTLAGLDYFRKIVEIQKKYKPAHKQIVNGIQTNGILLDEPWASFLAEEQFVVGMSIDGPAEMHDRYRVSKSGQPTHGKVIETFQLLTDQGVACEILCVVNAYNVQFPKQIYRYFKQLKAEFMTFLPLVNYQPNRENNVSEDSVPPEVFGEFLCAIFDEWQREDIGRVKIQIIEEATRTAFNQEHTLCIFKKTCGGVPVVEHNGDFYSCDHFVDKQHFVGNIVETSLVDLLESRQQRAFGQAKLNTLPRYCRACDVREMCNGECPKNRFIQTPDGETGLNYLCAGYKQFFTHCKPFIEAVAIQWQSQLREQKVQNTKINADKIGRNDPCPCGSGKKYKNCCLI